jgi:hypothetical protein
MALGGFATRLEQADHPVPPAFWSLMDKLRPFADQANLLFDLRAERQKGGVQ